MTLGLELARRNGRWGLAYKLDDFLRFLWQNQREPVVDVTLFVSDATRKQELDPYHLDVQHTYNFERCEMEPMLPLPKTESITFRFARMQVITDESAPENCAVLEHGKARTVICP